MRKKICLRDSSYAYLDEHDKKTSSTDTVPLQELLCPFQHVLRYQLMLQTMRESAKKQIRKGEAVGEQAWVNQFYINLKEGLKEMKDLNEYLNEYRRDSEILSDYAKGLDPKKVRAFEPYDLKRDFGVLKFQDFLEHKIKDKKTTTRQQSTFGASMKKTSIGSKDRFKPKYLLAFQGENKIGTHLHYYNTYLKIKH